MTEYCTVVPVHDKDPPLVVGRVQSGEPIKPLLDELPWTSIDPIVTETVPTFLTTKVIVFAELLSVAVSMEMLDCAATFCWLCWPPAADEVWDKNPCDHTNMITLMATATAIIISVARTGATAALVFLIFMAWSLWCCELLAREGARRCGDFHGHQVSGR